MARVPVWDVSCQGYLFGMYHDKDLSLFDKDACMYHDKDTCLGMYHGKDTCWGCIMARMPVGDVSWQGYLFEMYYGKDTCLGCVMTRISV